MPLNQPQVTSSAVIGGHLTVMATNVSSATVFSAPSPPFNYITLYNSGPEDIFYTVGDATAVATTSSICVPAGVAISDWIGANTYVAMITGSGASPVYIWQATGEISINGVGITGGMETFHINGGTAATTNATVVKAASGVVGWVAAISTNTEIVYLRFYDSATTPNPASSTNARPSLPVPASATGSGFAISFGNQGMQFINGISFVVTGGDGSDTDNVAAVTGVFITIGYR